MKKILLIVPVLALFAAAFAGCTQQQKWNHEQRKAMREALHDYRKMVYLEDLTDPEFVLFTDEVPYDQTFSFDPGRGLCGAGPQL